MSTILLATDFSVHAEIARARAAQLARRLGARVICVHATIMDNARPDGFELASGHVEEFRTAVQRDVAAKRSQLDAMARELEAQGIAAEARLLDGPPADAVCDAAREFDAELVILGSHGHTGFERLLLGSVAERIVRICHTSVLVARRPLNEMAGFRSVLALTDFQEPAQRAMALAMTLADDDAEVDVLHCWHLSEVVHASAEPLVGLAMYANLTRDVHATMERRGQELVKSWQTARRQVRFHLEEGRPAAAAQQFIESQSRPYDLIAVGTHGRRGVKRWLLGSVAETTVRHATCSVLIARERK
jgi:nucleotide-binding universal stress UspA family protein